VNLSSEGAGSREYEGGEKMTREEAEVLLKDAISKIDTDHESRDILFDAIKDLAYPDND